MKPNLLYIGNKLAKHGKNPTTIDHLSLKLAEIYWVKTYSEKKGKVWRMMDMVFGVIRNRNWADIVLIDTYSSKSALFFFQVIAFVCRVLKVPYVPYLHGGNFPEVLRKKEFKLQKAFSSASKIVSPSGYLQEAFEGYGYRVHIIPNYIEINNYPLTERNTFPPKILWVRAFQEIYNPLMALNVLKEVRKAYPEAELCMVGGDKDGTQKLFEAKVKQLGLGNAVRITGRMKREDWIKLSSAYSFFINTTNIDNTPVSVIEAMALGLPVVSTNVGGVPYLIDEGHTGFLVNSNDYKKMAERLIFLMADTEKSISISESGRNKVASFDWNVVKKNWQSLVK